jgi:nucleotide-binding universal stress UspA family protein
MFDKILLLLDGSVLAEEAIPYAREMAGRINAEVYILHVCLPEHQPYIHMHRVYMNNQADSFRQKMKDIQQSLQEPKVQAEVIVGDPARVIFDYIQDKDINFIIATTHGASGIRPWAIGSLADKIVRGSGVPTLLVRIKEERPQKTVVQRILVPLDISDSSKISVPHATRLAEIMNASITLFSMAQTAYAQHLGGVEAAVGVNWNAIDAATERFVDEYLQNIENEVKKSGVAVNHVSYLGIDPANEILEMEKRIGADIIVMATRGRSPVARWAFGSVTEKILRAGESPILLIKENAA